MLTDEERKTLVKYRIEKAHGTLVEAHDCAEDNHWTLAANRLYYAAYYASKALLIQDGIIAKSHEGVIGMIGQKFVVTGVISKEDAKLLARLQNMRKTGDYDDFIEWHQEEVEPLFEKVENYINKIKSIVESKQN
jgi:uncharacterized protein (UPF0332 family)